MVFFIKGKKYIFLLQNLSKEYIYQDDYFGEEERDVITRWNELQS